MKRHNVYISGPMTGLPEYNHPAFFNAHNRLIESGHAVINPAISAVEDTKHLSEPEWIDYMISCVSRMKNATAIHLLQGWESSPGALIEKMIADRMQLEVVS